MRKEGRRRKKFKKIAADGFARLKREGVTFALITFSNI